MSQSNSALQSLAFPLYCLAPANFKIEHGSDSKKIEALLGGIVLCLVTMMPWSWLENSGNSRNPFMQHCLRQLWLNAPLVRF